MLKETLITLYDRDLTKLKHEIEQYSDSSDLWTKTNEIPNSGGNLTLHLVGNLRHFIGAILGDTGYVRQRDNEFSDSEIPRADLLKLIDEAKHEVIDTLTKLPEERFNETYPIEYQGGEVETGYFLTHLTTHFNYHLGQLNYHRRLLSHRLSGETHDGPHVLP